MRSSIAFVLLLFGLASCDTECKIRQRQEALRGGVVTTECTWNGDFRPKQCESEAETCWCVDEKGDEIVGTRRGPLRPHLICTKCQIQRAIHQTKRLLGTFIPECTPEGEYDPMQCREGLCYCANRNGDEIPGTAMKNVGDPLPDCSKPRKESTVCERQAARARDNPGEWVPQCNTEDGSYKPKQCTMGMCWCVDQDGTEVPGTRRGRGITKGNPLTCTAKVMPE